jgi:predicted phosphodiesterase
MDQTLALDLISDLHLDYWEPGTEPDWAKGKSAGLLVVAGDISRNHDQAVETLEKLAKLYRHVIFIDGNHEHKGSYLHPEVAPAALKPRLAKISNLTYLHDDVYVENGVAFVGRNGWWDFKLAEPHFSRGKARRRMARKLGVQEAAVKIFAKAAKQDAEILAGRIAKLQARDDVTSIVVVTHTIPRRELLSAGLLRDKAYKAARRGSSALEKLERADKKRKIRAWLFGHQHEPEDRVIDGIRFLSNPRGKPNDAPSPAYAQKRAEIAPGPAAAANPTPPGGN